MMHIIRAQIEDFKRIGLVEIEPSGAVVQITGRNDAGKSSVLDAIEAALGGKRRQPTAPIRRGAEGARVVDLGDIIVERKWTKKSDQLTVKNKDGATYPRPQERLDNLLGGLAFDPLEFGRLPASAQRLVLLDVGGVEPGDLEDRRAVVYQLRRDVNRDHKNALARIGNVVEGAPDEEVDIEALDGDLAQVHEQRAQNRLERQEAAALEVRSGAARDRAANIADEISRISVADERAGELVAAGLKKMKARHAAELKQFSIDRRAEAEHRSELLSTATEMHRKLAEAATLHAAAAASARESSAKLADPEIEPAQTAIRQGQEANEFHQLALARRRRSREADELEAKSLKLTADLEAIDAEKAQLLAGAKMPIEGLGISDDGVTFEGNPFDQESTSRRITISTAIAAALNPELKIALVRDGNDLDDDTFEAFRSYCEEVGLQAWVEKISPVGEGAIVIEAGVVV